MRISFEFESRTHSFDSEALVSAVKEAREHFRKGYKLFVPFSLMGGMLGTGQSCGYRHVGVKYYTPMAAIAKCYTGMWQVDRAGATVDIYALHHFISTHIMDPSTDSREDCIRMFGVLVNALEDSFKKVTCKAKRIYTAQEYAIELIKKGCSRELVVDAYLKQPTQHWHTTKPELMIELLRESGWSEATRVLRLACDRCKINNEAFVLAAYVYVAEGEPEVLVDKAALVKVLRELCPNNPLEMAD